MDEFVKLWFGSLFFYAQTGNLVILYFWHLISMFGVVPAFLLECNVSYYSTQQLLVFSHCILI